MESQFGSLHANFLGQWMVFIYSLIHCFSGIRTFSVAIPLPHSFSSAMVLVVPSQFL